MPTIDNAVHTKRRVLKLVLLKQFMKTDIPVHAQGARHKIPKSIGILNRAGKALLSGGQGLWGPEVVPRDGRKVRRSGKDEKDS